MASNIKDKIHILVYNITNFRGRKLFIEVETEYN